MPKSLNIHFGEFTFQSLLPQFYLLLRSSLSSVAAITVAIAITSVTMIITSTTTTTTMAAQYCGCKKP